MSDVTPVNTNEADLTVAHLEHLMSSLPEDYVLHFEDREGNVFLVEKVSLDTAWESVDFHLRPVTREEQEEVIRANGWDPSVLD